MADYELYYWSVPFRGQFVRAVLAFAGKSWTEAGDDKISAAMEGAIEDMPVPFMGPPLLVDNANGFAVSQMPAIILYLGETLDLLPSSPRERALTTKVVNDANDFIDELTLNGGRDMWDAERWEKSVPRIQKWMRLWEDLGTRHGLTETGGYLLGGSAPGIADVVTATLWTTITDRFSKLDTLLAQTAPNIYALSQRVSQLPPLAELAEKARQDYGEGYAGGQIGASMQKFLDD